MPFDNNGFESGTTGWVASPDDTKLKLSQVTPGAAHTGTSGLKVVQDATGPGSWFQSPYIAIEAKPHQVAFWARCVSKSGIGVFVQFFDADKKNIPEPKVMLAIPPDARDWTEYHIDLAVPPNTAFVKIAVHSFSKQPCDAEFDDFTITPSAGTAAVSAPAPKAAAAAAPAPLPAVDPARVTEIASYLDPKAKGIGPSLDDRKAWDALAANTEFKDKMIPRAERFLTEPTPEISNELWMQSCKTSDRKAEPFIDRRRFRMATWTLAEGMENQGRFIPAIEKEIIAICSEPTWVLPAHDKQMLNYNGTQKMLDLGVGMTSWTLASVDSILGDKLSPSTRELIRKETRTRVIEPYLAESKGETHIEWWRTHNFNWNAVVHGGVVGTALALDDSVEERAQIIASVEKEIPFYFEGFPADGYSTEGMGYWKYGFGHFIMLSEAILNATHGKVNLYANEKARLAGQFPRRFAIIPNVYPAFADSPFVDEPSSWLFHIINSRYGLGDNAPQTLTLDGMFSTFLYAYGTNLTFDSSAPAVYTEGASTNGHQIRDWFEESQVLVDRMPEGKRGLNLAFKGANNGWSHGHVDVGTYVVSLGKVLLMVDPGSTKYGTNTFTSKRFENQILNSYGHSVPKVAGQLQKPGVDHFSTVAAKSFSEGADSVTLDMTKAYEVPALKQLTRKFDYDRTGTSSVTITDTAEFSSPEAFGTAIATYGEPKEEKPGVWTITQKDETVRLEISAGGLPFTVKDEILNDRAAAGIVHRIGIDLNAPAAAGTITVKVTPAA